ncbi:DUF551 domain-containing protein [Clostridium saccharoperbutylacetonicum]|uniref:DUF551 domain-containing protein n=1 Tax=Clostridium saccharoperbutylacetonicum TaxID=36745 RepID=UPI000983C778|nr:DUF551 domain-containing protein [Clostridium saccharoperbutylacetonicum]AQR95536.1 hypothetical protein CLSAP_28520 [Clostridium saccharoperbutylacetonicum]NSB31396.1 hypothetical protein [Clostridium saccharoperbutylacetonicum]
MNWISINERLPKEVGWVLVTREDGKVDLAHWFEEGWKRGHNANVVAWQPLPEPYKI